jgi:hypothetical protein
MIKNFLFFFFIASVLFSQTIGLQEIKKLYEDYEYEKVIQLSSSLINDSTLTDESKIDLFFMRAVSFFAIGNETNAKKSFENILQIDKNFSPDLTKLSPKIINLFDETKKDFLKKEEEKTYSPENLEKLKQLALERESQLKNSFLKNIFMPGWGQVSMGNNNNGYALIGFSSANLMAMIYYIIDTNKKENDYINEIDKSLIATKYDRFNSSYKKRNILISSFALLWIYSQLDLLLNSKYSEIPTSTQISISSFQRNDLQFNFRIPF